MKGMRHLLRSWRLFEQWSFIIKKNVEFDQSPVLQKAHKDG